MPSQDNSPVATSTNNSTPKISAKRKRRLGNKRDLALGLGYVVAVGALLGWGGCALCSWKSALDEIPPLNCYNPVWCTEGHHLAFLQTQPDEMGGNDSKCAMWTTDSHNEASQLVVKDLENSYRIVGWFDDDSTVVLQSHQGEDGHLVLMVVSLNDRKLNKFSFNDATIRLIGSSAKEIYLQRKLHNKDLNADEVELLTWSPSQPQLTKITSIPDRPSVEVNIDSVLPDLNARKFAMVLRYTPKTAPTTSPAAPPAPAQGAVSSEPAPTDATTDDVTPGQSQFSVWELDRDTKQLNWTSFSAINPLSVRTAWAEDATKIACIANYSGYSDIALYQDGADLRYVRLRTYTDDGDIVPQIRSAQPETYLVSNKRVLLYNFDSNISEVIADTSSFKLRPSSLALATGSDAIAISSHVATSTQIYLGSLQAPAAQHVDLADKVTPPTTLYELAAALQCASNFWSGQ